MKSLQREYFKFRYEGRLELLWLQWCVLSAASQKNKVFIAVADTLNSFAGWIKDVDAAL